MSFDSHDTVLHSPNMYTYNGIAVHLNTYTYTYKQGETGRVDTTARNPGTNIPHLAKKDAFCT